MNILHKNLRLVCIDHPWHLRTCGYWYLVRTDYTTPLTGFRTRESLIAWLDMLHIEAADVIPDKGLFKEIDIIGEYEVSTTCDETYFNQLDGLPIYCVSNADYTIGKINYRAGVHSGVATLTILGPNTNRVVFCHSKCSQLIDAGHYIIQEDIESLLNTYKGFKLVNIPSGMGGVLPAVVSKDNGMTLTVICLHEEYFPNWVLTVERNNIKPFSYRLDHRMRYIIESRITE
ncbi:hypothetical protein CWO84_10160 [Methylomonas sp. Kb3]|uniref:hypothetical protein n=1 Tax=Methylomonas sp. Kb3 TaxID=1611544 RepID=UPI000C31DB84|nr:hypothetical protein [Methylomonas sp. Kb3]PKD40491.1 hypothetical protein CWO84_10160 [Methylomonas sp. Kb3]